MTTEHEYRPDSPYSFQTEIAGQIRQQLKVINDLKALEKPTDFDTLIQGQIEESLLGNVELILRMKSNVTDDAPDAFPGFRAEQDGVTLFITTPPSTPEEKSIKIPLPVSMISDDHQQYLPPISVELAEKRFKAAEEAYYSSLSEADLNRILRDADQEATIFTRDRQRGHDPMLPYKIAKGEKAITTRNAAFMEVLRRHAAGSLESITIRPHIEVVLPSIPEDPHRDYQRKVDLDSGSLEPKAFKLALPNEE